MGALSFAILSRYWSTVVAVPWVRIPAVFFQSGVRISPGLTAFTRMLSLISSLARHLENMTSAALVVL